MEDKGTDLKKRLQCRCALERKEHMFKKVWEEFCVATDGKGIKNLLLSKDGEVIAQIHNDDDCLRNAYSVTKSITATAVGIAKEEGFLSIEEAIVDCFPDEIPKNPSQYLKHLKVKHLLSMTMGQGKAYLMGASRAEMKEKDWVRFVLSQPFVEEPGTTFCYTNAGPYLLGILVARRTGKDLAAYLYEKIFAPMGIWFPSWEVDPYRNYFGAGGWMATTKHLLLFGQLYLNHGIWEGKQLVPEQWVEEAKTPFFKDKRESGHGYGYGFWTGPYNTYRADGKYGQYSVIMEDKNAVLAVTADCQNPKEELLQPFWDMVYPKL